MLRVLNSEDENLAARVEMVAPQMALQGDGSNGGE
jgi:hypothetical protein